ncbi:phosphotransferase family protein [Streptomyces sp. NPDC096205]|uniref:phosphotransferase family protein n=1 Tax=Streptomyces sp. NPDC096205 TaxID=3366081 RepID=UPI00382D4855
MDVPPVPAGVLRAFVERAGTEGEERGGRHHRSLLLKLPEDLAPWVRRSPGTPVTVRVPRADALPVVVRTWAREAGIHAAARTVLPQVPRCLAEGDGVAVLEYVEGVTLAALCPDGKPVDTLLVGELTRMLADTARVRRAAVPPLPAGRPGNHTDSRAYLRTLAHQAELHVRRPNWPVYGGLFKALGVPEDALPRFAERLPALARRPYGLLHGDLHRGNVIVPHEDGAPLVPIDWELAGFGDPLHDLAAHLWRMRYPAAQWDEVIDAWAHAMGRVRPAALNGLTKDLGHYVDFERAQSAYAEVMRAARSLERSTGEAGLEGAAEAVDRALEEAAGPLGLARRPGRDEIARILHRRHAARADAAGRPLLAVAWEPDGRVDEHPRFPADAVTRALLAEGAAPAERVFKGTAHLNTVVRVPGVDFPVVVRRKVSDVERREAGYLSEHAVLRALERSGADVAAPRVLALGRCGQGEPFAVHTYVGPHDDLDRPPAHPVYGLLPHEADGLVDQLCELTRVDCRQIDPTAGEGGFHPWLCDQLAVLVAGLPDRTQQLARSLGLPDAPRLRQILARHRVTPRRPVLLHGDLNPWNLVRCPDRRALTLIDWELALVGDPLYDLVRHMHLTPTGSEIRDRMIRRWAERMPKECSRGWAEDWRVYRWLEIVRSAYVDLDRLVSGVGLDAPNVRRAVGSYAMTLEVALASLGLRRPRTAGPSLVRALA